MYRFKKSTFSLLATVAACLLLTSCPYEEPPISFASHPDFFTTWIFSEEEGVCSQGGTYSGSSQGQEIKIKITRNFTYEYTVDGELIQSGTFIARSVEVSFIPPIFPNNIDDHSDYLLTGPNLFITTTEQLNPDGIETCDVKRSYKRER